MIFGILAALASGTFTGAAIYVNLVEQPARLSCGIALAIAEWRTSCKPGSVMQASLAVSGSVLAFLSAWISPDHAEHLLRLWNRLSRGAQRTGFARFSGFPFCPETPERMTRGEMQAVNTFCR
jgi:hypothetical protein